MWVRKQIDISFPQLFWGLGRCFLPANRDRIASQIKSLFPTSQLLVSLSVRSGFELLWSSLELEKDSEVIMTGFTIPDMAKIVSNHGLKLIAVDVAPRSLSPDIFEIRQKITSKTKAIVVAHLWGGLIDLTEIAQLAKDHDLLLIEDCAQAYVNNEFTGDPRSDVAMFSFGAIKTNTALGGAILRVENMQLRRRMEQVQQFWPSQSRIAYFKRLTKYLLVKTISMRPFAQLISQSFRWFGSDHDHFASRLAKGFAGRDFFTRIQKRPSTPLLSMLHHKLSKFEQDSVIKRAHLGDRLTKALKNQGGFACRVPEIIGIDSARQTFWLYGILVEDPQGLARELWNAGFDATPYSSMRSVYAEKTESIECSGCDSLQSQLLLLPLDIRMQASEIDCMASVIQRSESIFSQVLHEDPVSRRQPQSKERLDTCQS